MNAARNAVVAAADWGTSHLRLWLLDGDGSAIAERRSDQGMLRAATTGFPAVLEGLLAELGADASLPVIVCGMAGARQGWIEAPYVRLPASLDAIFSQAVTAPGVERKVRIVPGLAQAVPGAPDVLRGEETQLAGASASFPDGAVKVCMPGTHSKWVDCVGTTVTGFRTFMTGELFAVLAGHSILRHAVGETPAKVRPDSATFRIWLEGGLAEPQRVTEKLFRIRAATLLEGLQPEDAAAALSGLLIGSEIAAGADGARTVVLVASGALAELYATAFAIAGISVISADADAAVRDGLWRAARRQFSIG